MPYFSSNIWLKHTVYRVGGKKGWEVPLGNRSGSRSADVSYNHWVERHRFQIGDSLRKYLLQLLHIVIVIEFEFEFLD